MLRKERADSLILAALDEVAWTFNIRGTDVAYNPVVISYAFVSEDESVLFIDPKKITAESAENLKKEGVILADYTMIQKYLSRLPENSRVFIDPAKTNISLYNAGKRIIICSLQNNSLKIWQRNKNRLSLPRF